MALVEKFEKLLASGKDNALLRFALGSEYLKRNDFEKATTHLRCAVEHEPEYSAAWKLLGKALTSLQKINEAGLAYRQGIEIAEQKGDVQAAKEMKVFLGRLQKQILASD